MKIRFDYTSDAILRSAASLFFRDPADVTLLSSSAREADDRAAATVTAGDGARYVLKLASNAFTHPRRIEGWTSLIRTARAMGVYMPALIPSLAGRIAETREIDGRPFVVWAEEFAPYPLAETQEEYGTDGYREKDAARPKSPDGCPAWQTELIRFNAKLAAARLPGGWGISGYARLAPPEDAETDEAEETLLEAERQIREKHPALLSRWRTLRAHWEENRDALASLYPRLPTSVFQADWNDTNVLLSEDGHFAGLIDYNLAGEDTALNMALSIGYYRFNATNPLTAEAHAQKVLRIFGEERAWNDDEIAAAPLLWKYLNAVWWGEAEDLEKAADDCEAARVLDRIEERLTESVDFRDAMIQP